MDPTARRSILLIDDEEGLRRVLGRYLQRHGYVVRVAGTVRDALSALDAERPDVILSDVRMPDHPDAGLAVLAHATALHPDVPVLLMSGYNDHEERTLRGGGARAVLRKPFPLDDLARALDGVLPPTA